MGGPGKFVRCKMCTNMQKALRVLSTKLCSFMWYDTITCFDSQAYRGEVVDGRSAEVCKNVGSP